MYRLGADRFFTDWQEFTESDVPVIVNPSPRPSFSQALSTDARSQQSSFSSRTVFP
jgi:hypothetical protein